MTENAAMLAANARTVRVIDRRVAGRRFRGLLITSRFHSGRRAGVLDSFTADDDDGFDDIHRMAATTTATMHSNTIVMTTDCIVFLNCFAVSE
jgi:hypothetical protein